MQWLSRPSLTCHVIYTGKSTLINALKADDERSAEASLSAKGVTKVISEYRGRPINDRPLFLLDTPGVGDGDVTPTKLLSLLEGTLKPDGGERKLDGVIVTTPAGDGRVKLGAQVCVCGHAAMRRADSTR